MTSTTVFLILENLEQLKEHDFLASKDNVPLLNQGKKLNFVSTCHWTSIFNKYNKKSKICTFPRIMMF